MTTDPEQFAFTCDIVRGYTTSNDKATVYLARIPIWQTQFNTQLKLTHEEVMQDFAQALSSALGSAVST